MSHVVLTYKDSIFSLGKALLHQFFVKTLLLITKKSKPKHISQMFQSERKLKVQLKRLQQSAF